MYFTIRSVVPALWVTQPAKLNVPFATCNTLVLVISSVWCQMGVWKAERFQPGRTGKLWQLGQWGMREWYVVTYLFGAIFIAGQIYEYAGLTSDNLTIPANAYGSIFYLATGFHGLHVTGGLIAFLLIIGRSFMAKTIRPSRGNQRDRHVVLLAFRRCGLDRPVRHDLPVEVTPLPTPQPSPPGPASSPKSETRKWS